MKKLIYTIAEKYHTSPAFASLAVTVSLTFLFQTMRLVTGHNDDNTMKLVKIITALSFMIWAFVYLKKQKAVL